MLRFIMIVFISSSLCVSSYAHAGLFTKLVVIGGVAIVGKSVIKAHQKTKVQMIEPNSSKKENTKDVKNFIHAYN